ncbi:Bug family tripartite tricarboxylate transporter substrate binding protein [Catenuloplanes japonicus]|uniref:Bug family tripartite tricarboxylate transporter substrate binding protein n=1 Tax=Catenuloplanes japonicus TaxID=33876 RepID=UPI000527284E|nr:tripartite tricarboxylate transporter substrate binding protein [Catenuloplanes japonicus]
MNLRRLATCAAALLSAAALLTVGDLPASPLDLRIMVPNAPGSGYDVTARTAATALEDAGLVGRVEVFNLPGGGAAVGARRMVYERGTGGLLMLMGLGVAGTASGSLRQTTPVARLIQEPSMVVVTPDSPYRTLAELVDAWRADPGAVPVGGGSLPGGPDHLAPMLLARAVGIAPPRVRYLRYDGGGDLLAAILGKRVAFGVSGVGEYADQVRSGQLRVLAVTGAVRVTGVAAPTLREAGVDLEFTNWRGVVAPSGLSEADSRRLHDVIARMVRSPQWQEAVRRNGWIDAYLGGDDFDTFLAAEMTRLDAVLTDLELPASGG